MLPHLAAHVAENFIKERKITALPVDPIAIAQSLDIEVCAKPPSSEGVSGMLLRMGNEFAIVYATHIKSEGFQHFCVGHELGHYMLSGHIEQLFADGQTTHYSHAGFTSYDKYEQEADFFSAGLLMPEHLCSKELKYMGDGLDAVEALSIKCETSLPATAIRYAALAKIPTAIVVSKGQHIEYGFMSDSLRELDGLQWIRKGQLVPGGTATERFNLDANNVKSAQRVNGTTNLASWFESGWDTELYEEVKGLGDYGKTLTVLYTPDELDQAELDEDAELEASYEVRFRR